MDFIDNKLYVVNALVGFLGAALLCAASYLPVHFIARWILIGSSPRRIAIVRFLNTLGLVVFWFYMSLQSLAGGGNSLHSSYWYHRALHTGFGYGALTIVAWLIVSILECFRRKHADDPVFDGMQRRPKIP